MDSATTAGRGVGLTVRTSPSSRARFQALSLVLCASSVPVSALPASEVPASALAPVKAQALTRAAVTPES